MKTRKIEVDEGDLKKVILMLKLSKPYLQIPNDNLALHNMWRVSGKLTDKFMRKAELAMVTNKGRTTLKPVGEVYSEISDKAESSEEKTEEVVKPSVDKVPRCRKRKSK